MEYMLLIYGEDTAAAARSAADAEQMHAEYMTLTQEMMQAGAMVGGSGLQGSDTATSVRVRNNSTSATDGPYAETKEVLGGYYIVECEDLDQAIEWAARIPGARLGCIEIRPLMKVPANAEPTT